MTVSYLAALKEEREGAGDLKEASPWESDEDFLRRIGSGLHVYHFESLLGSGGMGRVYLARHVGLRRRCAVKVLSPRVSQLDFDYVERFQHEGRAAAALNHPNIVVTHAIGEERGFHFLEMEYVPGGSLRQLVREEGPLSPIRATRLIERVAHGLAAAHRRGIVHRDLKSDNIMLTLAGVPKISDFGLAKTLHLSDAEEAAVLVGTPAFMAPELFAGAAAASGASDVYALGVIYFELLTGQVPFRAANFVDLRRAVQEDPVPNIRRLVKDIPLEMAECLARMLDKCPSNRPANGAEAAQLLAAVAGHAPDIHTLLTEAFADAPEVIWTRNGDAFQLRLQLPGGRKQEVTVSQNSAASSERLLMISSLCGPAEPSYFEEALRLNGMMSHGSITIQDVGGRPMFCAVNSYPRETVDPEEVRRSVMEIASRADAIERLLTTQDLH